MENPAVVQADAALDVLAMLGRSEAKLAAVKAQAAAVLADATKALNAPAGSPQEAGAQDRSLVAEVGCALATGDRAAGALLAEAHALTTSLPRTLAALQSDDGLGARPGPWWTRPWALTLPVQRPWSRTSWTRSRHRRVEYWPDCDAAAWISAYAVAPP